MQTAETKIDKYRLTMVGLALLPALYDWDFTKAWALLLAGMTACTWIRPETLHSRLSAWVWFGLVASSLWALLQWLPLPGLWVGIIWLLFSGLWITEIAYPLRESLARDPFWPPQKAVGLVLCGVLLVFLGVHYLFNIILHKPFDWDWWTPVLWGTIAVLLSYPARLECRYSPTLAKRLRWLCLILIVLVLGSHVTSFLVLWRQYVSVATQADQTAYKNISQTSFERGYSYIGAVAAVRFASYLTRQNQWAQAILYLREQWIYEERRTFAERFSNFRGDHDKYYFTLTFGTALPLRDSEQAVDFEIDREKQALYILTSQGELLRIDKTLVRIASLDHPTHTLAYHPSPQRWAVLGDERMYVLNSTFTAQTIPLPKGRVWAGVDFLNENELWVSDAAGQVERLMHEEEQWRHGGTVFPPLWQEQAFVQTLRMVPNAPACYLLDRYGAVHLRGSVSTSLDLDHHYHSQRPVMRALSLAGEQNPDELFLLNNHGWVYSLPPDKPMQVLFPPGEAVDLIHLPEIHTILQLYDRGWIVPFVMPQGAPIYPNGKAFRLRFEFPSN